MLTMLKRPVAALVGLLAGLAATIFVLNGGLPIFDPPPETRVEAYLQATARGDEPGALGVWQTWTCCIPRPELEARRSDLTRELVTLGVGRRVSIRMTEWWRTCCEPGIIKDPRNAGRARIFVKASDREGRDHDLVFEVWVRDGAWWGDAGGQTRRDWTLREVYRRGERTTQGGPVAPLTAEAAIRSAHSLARIDPGTRFETKRTKLGDLKRELGAVDFTPGADPERNVWVVAAIGPVGRQMSEPPRPWAVFALDVDDHIVLGIQFGDAGERPPYFDGLPER